MFEPQLAKPVAEIPLGDQYVYSVKLDGYRLLVQDGNLFSRTGEDWNEKFPEIHSAVQELGDHWFDGEVCVETENPFADLHAGRGKPEYYIFDVPSHKGNLSERLDWLQNNVVENEYIKLLWHNDEPWDPCERRQEGIMIKDLTQTYQFGKRRWMKYKCSMGQEFLILGYTAPTGKRKHFGALILGYYDNDELKFAGRVGTGFTDEQIEEIFEVLQSVETCGQHFEKVRATWLKPKLVAQISFMNWTTANRLRHPVFVSLRSDKDPKDVVREMA